MRVLVAGGSGAIGRPLLTRLVSDGHDVLGLTRSTRGAARVEALGATPVLGDVLEAPAIAALLRRHRPDAVIEQTTALPASYTPDAMRDSLAATNRVRIEGGGNLYAAAVAAGVRRYVAQSGCYYYEPGAGLADEATSFARNAPPLVAGGIEGLTAVEQRVTSGDAVEGTVLRYGFFYGPGTWYAVDGDVAEQVRAAAFPITGEGTGVWPFVHVEDAATATAAALAGAPGIYNVADRHAEPLAAWLPAYARWLGAPPPPTVPASHAGADQLFYALHLRGADSARAEREIGFVPRPRAWITGRPASPVIRPEQPGDRTAIHDVVTAAFGRPDEADLVDRLRRTPEHIPELSFVAEIDGTVVGHLALSRVRLIPAGRRGLALAPVSVAPNLQGRGIGADLIRHALSAAQARGETFVVVLGHPGYYPRFGFEPAHRLGVRPPWDVPTDSWMIHVLGNQDGTSASAGVVQYSDAFTDS